MIIHQIFIVILAVFLIYGLKKKNYGTVFAAGVGIIGFCVSLAYTTKQFLWQ